LQDFYSQLTQPPLNITYCYKVCNLECIVALLKPFPQIIKITIPIAVKPTVRAIIVITGGINPSLAAQSLK
jgi:hypothetical protein